MVMRIRTYNIMSVRLENAKTCFCIGSALYHLKFFSFGHCILMSVAKYVIVYAIKVRIYSMWYNECTTIVLSAIL